jgi:acetyl-CoA carboxylase alpha subunit
MLALGLIDGVVPEPTGGAHNNPDAATALVDQALSVALDEVTPLAPQDLLNTRYDKFRRMGEEGTAFVDLNKPAQP